ncbi:MurR/RpiR family transcriptional regulator [Staphylococcus saccharolyticus]|uniref:MurR/RpiR family transcriptional regulator n=1 Tax=Staphylococcus saccharolyticus TaxID=33028 RepID=UPI000E1C3B0D|nr:MurR/RpiR family transcriptional regulator [Staphylococcus saccharolyticus]MBL7564841.1 MurR/RpiR family transcriptional regulator [Staphylococcus saccharolyticus]MBL7570895.1 MurR/RpiR family transcriptional regulator [Staphylococcus saccharolyticus]QQB99305.1 MurR/RpiR family transcriptional regulator [Staphylococcus saccharolyticus]QRJ67482.1 MurR/RpiR family transcriptional regulator [Staphylococcus saccharolyticus]RTX96595.1 MurR/RpiR family transcriptional regulator [Staphylococcus sa
MILDERVNSNFNQLNDNDIQIVHYVNTHIEKCQTIKIQELAHHTHASNAMIHRFTRKLGFDGYSDFKSFLKFENHKKQQLPSDSMEQFKQEIENTFSYLERIDYHLLTNKMHEATTIYLYGTCRAQMNVAKEAQRILLTMHKNIIILHDVYELKMVLNKTVPKDLFFIISLSGETYQLTEVTQLLQLRQKFFISITTMKDNSLAQQANYNIYVSSNTFYLNDGTDYSSFISYHIFFETLLRKYNKRKENNELI